ncbi:Similar to BORCS5: BLOC-1-related complex subunit 5 (Gallus gallus) [Cotesia congregata]|uniref:BLOC-1-related complex subunit 5 n=1 Tax=Cotesia congregata TaxID=51543 RepID=A0A8J2HSK1_COTCN|nr:Similar to BORCS5: BLOC-1-related complex subunit 5 (Gallus gallus) [Cotesia congregata]
MGSEQSSQGAHGTHGRFSGQSRGQLRRGKSVPSREHLPDDTTPRSSSPGPSICSDSDLPYISYTVNQPIGDSPKISNKPSLIRGKSFGSSEVTRRKSSLGLRKTAVNSVKSTSTTAHNIVVVKPAISDPDTDKDPDLIKLQSIPMFLPIMRGTLNLPPGVRDPEILERLDPVGLYNLCARYQHHLNANAQMIANEQNSLCVNIDIEINKIMTQAVERQKKFAKFAEHMNKVHELSKQLTKCHMQLNQTLESLETLNNLLPIKDRLEPFQQTVVVLIRSDLIIDISLCNKKNNSGCCWTIFISKKKFSTNNTVNDSDKNKLIKRPMVTEQDINSDPVESVDNNSSNPTDQADDFVEPVNCCMSGCTNCVWIQYAEKLSETLTNSSDDVQKIIMEKVSDSNMRAFLSMELRLRNIIK